MKLRLSLNDYKCYWPEYAHDVPIWPAKVNQCTWCFLGPSTDERRTVIDALCVSSPIWAPRYAKTVLKILSLLATSYAKSFITFFVFSEFDGYAVIIGWYWGWRVAISAEQSWSAAAACHTRSQVLALSTHAGTFLATIAVTTFTCVVPPTDW